MSISHYFKAKLITNAKHRFDVTHSTNEHDFLERLLINKRSNNVGGLSFNHLPQPESFRGKQTDAIISKGSMSISKIIRPDINSPIGYGDINGTNDACIIVYNDDFKLNGVNEIQLFIFCGCKNDRMNIYSMFVDGSFNDEVELLSDNKVNRLCNVVI